MGPRTPIRWRMKFRLLNQLSPPAGTLIGTLEIADNGTSESSA